MLCDNCTTELCADRGKCQIIYCSSHTTKPIQTHADRIRAMSDEELAAYWVNCSCICDWCSQKEKCDIETVTQEQCVTGVLEWLKQPAEVSGDG